MARQLRIESPWAFYHAAFKGNEQKEIFKERKIGSTAVPDICRKLLSLEVSDGIPWWNLWGC